MNIVVYFGWGGFFRVFFFSILFFFERTRPAARLASFISLLWMLNDERSSRKQAQKGVIDSAHRQCFLLFSSCGVIKRDQS